MEIIKDGAKGRSRSGTESRRWKRFQKLPLRETLAACAPLPLLYILRDMSEPLTLELTYKQNVKRITRLLDSRPRSRCARIAA